MIGYDKPCLNANLMSFFEMRLHCDKERYDTRFGILGMVRGFGDTGGDIAARLLLYVIFS